MGKPSPPDTLPTVQEPAAKFVWLTGPVLGKIQAERLAELIWSADEWGGTDSIFDECLAGSG